MEIIEQIGSYAGFAAVVGLAILSALYFSQARDVKRLREWAGRAPDREPAPVVPAQPRPAAQPARPAAQPVTASGNVTPVPRPPGAVTPAAASAAGAAAASIPQPAQETAAAENGDAADEASVTSFDTVVHPPPSPEGGDTGEHDEVTAQDTGEYDPLADDEDDEVQGPVDETGEEDALAEDDVDEPAPAPEPATFTPRPAPPPLPARSPPPPRRPGGTGTSTIIPPYSQSRPGAPTPPASRGGLMSTPARAVAVVGASIVAAIAIGYGALQIAGGEDEPEGTTTTEAPLAGNAGNGNGGGNGARAVDPSEVTVSVLNGTTVQGLAAGIGDQIEAEGFQLAAVTNFSDQQRAESVVLFAPGAEAEARAVSNRLGIAQREPIDPESQALAQDATVVVIAGADQANG